MSARLIIAFLCMLPFSAHAQVGFSLYTSSMYDDNSFAFYEKREDVYHALSRIQGRIRILKDNLDLRAYGPQLGA